MKIEDLQRRMQFHIPVLLKLPFVDPIEYQIHNILGNAPEYGYRSWVVVLVSNKRPDSFVYAPPDVLYPLKNKTVKLEEQHI